MIVAAQMLRGPIHSTQPTGFKERLPKREALKASTVDEVSKYLNYSPPPVPTGILRDFSFL